VALNHPNKASNGGLSKFFLLPQGIDAKQAKLLDGQYAPFGYVLSGSNVYQTQIGGRRKHDMCEQVGTAESGVEENVPEEKNRNEDG